MVTLKIPSIMHDLTAGRPELRLEARSVRDLLDGLAGDFAAVKDRVCDPEGGLVPFIRVFINSKDARKLGGMDAALQPGDVVTLVPAIAGG